MAYIPSLTVFLCCVWVFANSSRLVNGRYIRIGDMLYTQETYDALHNLNATSTRAFRNEEKAFWPRDSSGFRRIPYKIHKSVDQSRYSDIGAAMKQWTDVTCVKFIPNEVAREPHFIKFQSRLSGCFSAVGNNKFRGGQIVNIGSANECTVQVIAHELGHTLGLGHEHTSPIRDDHILIFRDNINDAKNDFDKKGDVFSTFNVPYNYKSVMHYHSNIFAKNKTLPTILPKNVEYEYLLRSNNDVSHYDALMVNRAYKCEDVWEKICKNESSRAFTRKSYGKTIHTPVPRPKCLNHGYFGKECHCVCAPGTSGVHCEIKEAQNLPAYPPPTCGGVVEDPVRITHSDLGTSLGISRRSEEVAPSPKHECIWVIRRPKGGAKIEVIFDEFELGSNCKSEFFEIRIASVYQPDQRNCGKSLQGSKLQSTSDMVLRYFSKDIPTVPRLNISVAFI